MQGRTRLANRIYSPYQVLQAVWIISIPNAHLVFLRIQILFAAGANGSIFVEFKRWTVNPVARTKSCGQNKPGHKRRAAALLEIFVQNVRRVRPYVGSKHLSTARLSQLRGGLGQVRGRVLPL